MGEKEVRKEQLPERQGATLILILFYERYPISQYIGKTVFHHCPIRRKTNRKKVIFTYSLQFKSKLYFLADLFFTSLL